MKTLEASQSLTPTPELQLIKAAVIAFTPGWLEARKSAERNAHQDRLLNQQEHDAFAPINRLLDEMVALDPRLGCDE
jgi:hypothetical protein